MNILMGEFTGDEEKLPEGYNSFTHGLENALTKANNKSFFW